MDSFKISVKKNLGKLFCVILFGLFFNNCENINYNKNSNSKDHEKNLNNQTDFLSYDTSSTKKDKIENTFCENNNSNTNTFIRKDVITGVDESNIKLNQLQFIASHNSYKLNLDKSIYKLAKSIEKVFHNNFGIEVLDYEHLHPEIQMSDYDIRGLEIDVHPDSYGNTFYDHKIFLFANPMKDKHSYSEELKKPGFKVLHVKDLDFETHYPTFKKALSSIKNWSENHPNHLPLFINVEFADATDSVSYYIKNFHFIKPTEEATPKLALDLDNEVRDIFGENLNNIITPQRLLNMTNAKNFREFTQKNLWPTVKNFRGKIFFILEGKVEPFYKENEMQKIMFVYYNNEITDNSLFILKNNPLYNFDTIRDLVSKNYFVRTRSDENTTEARTGNYDKYLSAISSGAQLISTDYYKSDYRAGTPGWTDYKVCFGKNINIRLNPVNY